MTNTDWNDIQASLCGAEDAYARLMGRYQRAVGVQMWRFSRDASVCEELVQDVFIEVYFSLAKYRGDAPFLHWVRRIATRVGYRYWKEQAKKKPLVPLEEWTEVPSDDDPANASQAAETLHKFFGRLGVEDRLVLTLMYFEECSVREIADRTGWNFAMVKMRAYRARKKLRQIMEDNGVSEAMRWTR